MIAAAGGFDAIYITLEHNPTSLETASAIRVAALGIGDHPDREAKLDMLHIASSDLSTEMGIPGQYQHARMRQAYEATAKAARAHGKSMGVGGVRDDFESQNWLMQLGMRYLTCGSHVGFILSAGRADVRQLREVRLS
jgi:2-keto-3-deoxy-L-rhamnonate aldolase RhmA